MFQSSALDSMRGVYFNHHTLIASTAHLIIVHDGSPKLHSLACASVEGSIVVV